MLLLQWMLNVSNYVVMIGATLMVQSTIIITLGIFTAYTLRNKGASVQSLVLRVFLVAVLLSPILSLCFHAAGVKVLTFSMPPASLHRLEEIYSSPQNDYAAVSLPREVNPQNYPRETTVGAEQENTVDILPIEKDTPASSKILNETYVSIPHEHNLLSTQTNEFQNELQNAADGMEEKYANAVSPTVKNTQVIQTEFKNKSPTQWMNKRVAFYFIFTFAWAAFSLFLFIRFILHNLHIQHIRHAAFNAKPSFITTCKALASELGIKAPVVLQSNSVKSPFVSGLFRPFILMPLGEHESSLLSREVFLHELSHIERHDYLWNLLRQIGIIILPFQPLMWMLSHWIEETSDYVCDDFVMKYSGNHRSYAANLLSIAQCYQQAGYEMTAGVGILSFKSPLRRRIGRILDGSHTLSLRTNIRLILCISFLCFCTTVATGFIGFEGESTIRRNNSSVNLSGAVVIDRLMEILTGELFLPNFSTSAGIFENLPVDHAANIGFISAVESKNDQIETEPEEGNVTITPAGILSAETSLSYSSGSEELSANPTADFELSAESVSTVVSNNEKSGADSEDSVLIVSLTKITDKKIHLSDSSVPEEHPENPSAVSAPNKDAVPSAKVADEKDAGQPDESNIITDQNSDFLTPSVFTAGNAGMQLTGFRGNKIRMPVAKAVNVTVDFDYANYEFDLRNEEEKRQYSIYHGLDKLKNEPAWSPDGKWIAFTDRNRIWLVSPEGGEPKLVYENFHDGFSVGNFESLSFTPDSKEITFKKDIYDENRGSVVTISTNGSSRYATFSNPIPNIESVNISTGEHHVIIEEGYRFCWSHRGRYICFLSWDARIGSDGSEIGGHGLPAMYDTKTGETRFLSDDDGKKYGKPTFSPDDTHIIIPVRENWDPIELCRISIDGSRTEQLTFCDEHDGYGKYLNFPEYSPDGRWVLYTDFTRTEEQPDKRLFLYSTITGEQFEYFQNAETRNSLGKWSPDGTKICYLVQEDSANYIYICDFFPENYKLQKPALEEKTAPLSFKMKANYPNPFNTSTTIEFSLPEAGHVSLVIYNIMGQKVRELVSVHTEPGSHSAVWDGCDENGMQVASGMYISRLQMGRRFDTGKMMLTK